MGEKRWLTVVVIVVAVAVVVALLPAFVGRLGELGYLSVAQKEPTPEYRTLPVAEGEPVCGLVDWHSVAVFLERIFPVDVIVLREEEGIAGAAILPLDMPEEGYSALSQLVVDALLIWGSDDLEWVTVAFLLAPGEDEVRYPMELVLVCEVIEGEAANCEMESLEGSYLAQDHILWPGRE